MQLLKTYSEFLMSLLLHLFFASILLFSLFLAGHTEIPPALFFPLMDRQPNVYYFLMMQMIFKMVNTIFFLFGIIVQACQLWASFSLSAACVGTFSIHRKRFHCHSVDDEPFRRPIRSFAFAFLSLASCRSIWLSIFGCHFDCSTLYLSWLV